MPWRPSLCPRWVLASGSQPWRQYLGAVNVGTPEWNFRAKTFSQCGCSGCAVKNIRQNPDFQYSTRYVVREEYYCPFDGCRATFSSRALLNSHQITHVPVALRKCRICSRTFPSLAICIRHEKSCGQPPVGCDFCKAV